MAETVLWDDDGDQLVVELKARHEANMRSIDVLQRAVTIGDVRMADVEQWAQSVVDGYVESIEDEGGRADDTTPFDFNDHIDAVIDLIPLPHDAEVAMEWLGRDFLYEHADVGGASPGGNIDVYTVRDRGIFFEALQARGYEVRHEPGLMQDYYAAL